MREVVLASRNAHKIAEFETLLSQYSPFQIKVLSLDDIGYHGEIEEDGDTFEENAIIKASVPAKLGYIGIADDSGLAVNALDGAPGVYSARYSGDGATDATNNALLLKNLAGVNDRSASFVCTAACVLPASSENNVPQELAPIGSLADFITKRGFDKFGGISTVRGECAGTILHELHGEGGFGYDPLFYVESAEKTYAELSSDEKNKISHRGNAVKQFAAVLAKILAYAAK